MDLDLFEDEKTKWWEWNGSLTREVYETDETIKEFISRLLERTDIPHHSQLMAQSACSKGGLGLIYTSHRAATDFVITMINAMKFASKGVRLNKDLESTTLCSTIGALCSKEENPESTILNQFRLLLPHIAKVPTPPSTPDNERV